MIDKTALGAAGEPFELIVERGKLEDLLPARSAAAQDGAAPRAGPSELREAMESEET